MGDIHQTSMNRALTQMLCLMPCLLLMACTTQQSGGVVSATVSPLADLNLVNEKIPDVLKEIQKAPYAPPEKQGCAALRAEIYQLDQVLGPDLDATGDGETSVGERAGNYVADRAAGTVRATTESLIPFRSWVRKLSGAERHSRQVAAALHAGTVRRSFLKGMSIQCRTHTHSPVVETEPSLPADEAAPTDSTPASVVPDSAMSAPSSGDAT